MEDLLQHIRNCTLCKEHLPLGPRPIVAANPKAKILIIGHAPGTKVHQTGIPWDDQSGKQLRKWMGVTDEEFYDETKIAQMPMGFCYPGKGRSGDLAPTTGMCTSVAPTPFGENAQFETDASDWPAFTALLLGKSKREELNGDR